MKVLPILFTAIVVACNLSCQKNNATPGHLANAAVADNPKLAEFLAIGSIATQKIAYGLLKPEEKYFVWADHLQKFENSPDYNNEQKTVIKGFLSILSPAFFENNKL